MGEALWPAVSGAMAQMRQLDVTANNIANAGTPGYQADRLVFREVLSKTSAKLRYAGVAEVARDTTAGAIRFTGNPLDVALREDGHIALQSPDGPRYTRLGKLQIDAQGTLRSSDGLAVADANGKPIAVPTPSGTVTISEDGSVMADGNAVGKLHVVRFLNRTDLEKERGAILRPVADAGVPQVVDARFEVAALEGSNFSAVKGMAELIQATRAFDACQKVVEAVGKPGQRDAAAVMTPR